MRAKRFRRPFVVHVLRGVGGAGAVIAVVSIAYAASAIDWSHFRIGSEPEPFVVQSLAIGLGCLLASSLWYGIAAAVERLDVLAQLGGAQPQGAGAGGDANGQYLYLANGQQVGPVGVAEIQRLINEGAITANTMVSRVGEGGWIPLRLHPDFTVG